MKEERLTDLFPEDPVITLDRPRRLHLGFLAWMRLEPFYRDFTVLFANIVRIAKGEGPILEDLLLLIWAMCLEEAEDKGERPPTVPEIRKQLNVGRLQEYIKAVHQAIQAAMPQDPPAPDAGMPSPGPGAGPTNGAPGSTAGTSGASYAPTSGSSAP